MNTRQSDILLVDKPVGFSSFQIVRLLKRTNVKVGHAGTLDPFASGLLIMLIGRATRRFDEFQVCEKEYHGEMLLGYVTDTYDITGRVVDHHEQKGDCVLGQLRSVAREFVGKIEQGEIPLQDSLSQYEKGMALIKHCREILQKAEKRIEKISKEEKTEDG